METFTQTFCPKCGATDLLITYQVIVEESEECCVIEHYCEVCTKEFYSQVESNFAEA